MLENSTSKVTGKTGIDSAIFCALEDIDVIHLLGFARLSRVGDLYDNRFITGLNSLILAETGGIKSYFNLETSLCGVCLRQARQCLVSANFSGVSVLFLSVR